MTWGSNESDFWGQPGPLWEAVEAMTSWCECIRVTLIKMPLSLVYFRAYEYFDEAALLNHKKAMELVAEALLFGDHMEQNVTRSRELYQALADKGNARGQMGLGFLYTTGIAVNSSQAKVGV